MTSTLPTRRQFLQGAGGIVITFALSGLAGRNGGAEPRVQAEATPMATPAPFTADQTQEAVWMRDLTGDRVDSWLSIDRDGRVTVYVGKVDLGTGVMTALAQIAAEELDVRFSAVTVIQGDTDLTPDQ